ncbi:hypothetical protein BC936DRAFT_146183 [Jimgerdemannia flammicorona]|uniref:Uncharacterized protein n=2 Tax=Jimgerdemannia flammicorona TaxID=994334 RepID=A0A433D855_9FUNG|nr:hypothetical protein BC936DRAFT_146183 [Jimgerdemannia flammicorona]RUS30286.1 hypothetical protein BC938DRAFT_479615 [Jimgerdemannia flammicorona]
MHGINGLCTASMRSALLKAGLEDVTHTYTSAPAGWGPVPLGQLMKRTLVEAFKEGKPTVTKVMGVAEKEYDRMLEEVLEEMGGTYRPYVNVDLYVGRRPKANMG